VSFPPIVTPLLDALREGIQAVLGQKLVGLYVYGSLVWGDFDPAASDVDLLAALTADLTDPEFEAIRAFHADFVARFPAWDDRIEVQYCSVAGLQHFREVSSPMCVISPGDPFHRLTAGPDWLMNWYFVRTYGLTLYGPPPETVIAPISKAEFVNRARLDAPFWRGHIVNTRDSRQYQAYAVLTLCRCYYTVTHGEQVSKRRAAIWAAEQLPDWADLIQAALIGRSDPAQNCVTYPEAERFVHFMADLIESLPAKEG
jgi:hypothetical protein